MKRNILKFESLVSILSLLIGLGGIFGNIYIQHLSNITQVEVKKYEVTFVEKQKNYTAFLQTISNAHTSALEKNNNAFLKYYDQVEIIYYSLEPFLNDKAKSEIWNKVQEFIYYCGDLSKRANVNDETVVDTFISYRHYFQDVLYSQLFGGKTVLELDKSEVGNNIVPKFINVFLSLASLILVWFCYKNIQKHLNKHQRKERRYKKIIFILYKFYIYDINPALLEELMQQLNLCYIYFTDNIIKKINDFFMTIQIGSKYSNLEKQEALAELINAIHQDLTPPKKKF